MNNEKKSTLINIAGLVVLALAVLAMSLGLIKGTITGKQANIIVGTGLAVFWLLSDIVEPFVCGRMQDTTLAQKEAYVKYIALDLIGYAGVMYFLMGVGGNGKSGGILGAVVFAVSMKPKRNQRDIFLGIVTEEEKEEEHEEEAEEWITADTIAEKTADEDAEEEE